MVPCLALHEIDFHMGSLGSYVEKESGDEREYESISAMFNEIVAHRVGMLPIPTDKKTIEAFGNSIDDIHQFIGNISASNISSSGDINFTGTSGGILLNGSSGFIIQSWQIIANQNIMTADGKGIKFGVDSDYTMQHAGTATNEARLTIKEGYSEDIFIEEVRMTIKKQTPRLIKIKTMKKIEASTSKEPYQQENF